MSRLGWTTWVGAGALLMSLSCVTSPDTASSSTRADNVAKVPPDPTTFGLLAPAGKHAFGPLDLVATEGIGAPVPTRDGNAVYFTRRTLDPTSMRNVTSLWTLAIADGAAPVLLWVDDGGISDLTLSSDGQHVFYASARDGLMQVVKRTIADGEEAILTRGPLDVETFLVSPDEQTLLLSYLVFLDCVELACSAQRLIERAAADSATAYDRLFVRHWDTWKDGRRRSLFVQPMGGGELVALTRTLDADVPPLPFSGREEIAFHPTEPTVVFSARDAGFGSGEPWSTNFDLYSVGLDGKSAPQRLTDNPAWDARPVFDAKGENLWFLAMRRPGFEADRFDLRALSWKGRTLRTLADNLDRSIDELLLDAAGNPVVVFGEDLTRRVARIDATTGVVTRLTDEGTSHAIALAGERIFFLQNDLTHPDELFVLDNADKKPVRRTQIHARVLAQVEWGAPAKFSFAGAGKDTVRGLVLKPAGFVEGKRYPLVLLLHGGPQGSFGDSFHARWNPEIYAGAGYAVATIDFHGSTGHGQAFTDAIRGDWGGKPLEDVRRGLDAVLAQNPWIDGSRVCALGASYGGYLINWLASQEPDRFRCFVNHDGIFDMRMMYYATEELWFPEWEHGGAYFDAVKGHERHNPALHVKAWKTPMLVVHGSLDYRVPIEQGLATFTALKRQGVKARFLHFPDENHWVLKPKNRLRWHREVNAWLDEHLQEKP